MKLAFEPSVVSAISNWLKLAPPFSEHERAALSLLLGNGAYRLTYPAVQADSWVPPALPASPDAVSESFRPPSVRAASVAAAAAAAAERRHKFSGLSFFITVMVRVALWPIFCFLYILAAMGRYRCSALQRATLLLRLEMSHSYFEWRKAALALDTHEGQPGWKSSLDPGPLERTCDLRAVSDRLVQLSKVYLQGNTLSLAHALREGLVRNLAGICHPDVFSFCRVGTKTIIEDYVNIVSYLLLFVAHAPSNLCGVPATLDRVRFFNETRHAFGRTALMLSGGAVMGLHHLGIVKALLEHDLLPRVVSGTSAGAIVASIVGIFDDVDLQRILASEELINPITGLPFSFRYFDESLTVMRRLRRLVRKGAVQDVRMLQDCLRKNFGDLTFGEAYRRTRRILNITVCPARGSSGPPLLLNYLTCPNVLIWSAASASCALPLVFGPVALMMKEASSKIVPYQPGGQLWIDGSVTSDVPLARVGELFNVNHFIVSQTNFHIVPRGLPFFQTRIAQLIKSEFQFRYWQALQLRLVPRVVSSLFPHMTQPYEGDVTLMPEVNVRDLMGLFTNPTIEVVRDFIQRGERAMFPKLERVRLQCLVERTLDSCVDTVVREEKRMQSVVGPANHRELDVGDELDIEQRKHRVLGRVPSWLWVESAGTPPPEPSQSGDSTRGTNENQCLPAGEEP